MNATFVKSIETENTGGGVMVDYITLKDGKVIEVNELGIALYHTKDNVTDFNAIGFISFPNGEIVLPDENNRELAIHALEQMFSEATSEEIDNEADTIVKCGILELDDLEAFSVLVNDGNWKEHKSIEFLKLVNDVRKGN